MIKAEDVLRQEKYKELRNLVLICEAMDEFFEKKRTEMLRDEAGLFTGVELFDKEQVRAICFEFYCKSQEFFEGYLNFDEYFEKIIKQ